MATIDGAECEHGVNVFDPNGCQECHKADLTAGREKPAPDVMTLFFQSDTSSLLKTIETIKIKINDAYFLPEYMLRGRDPFLYVQMSIDETMAHLRRELDALMVAAIQQWKAELVVTTPGGLDIDAWYHMWAPTLYPLPPLPRCRALVVIA